ncbi:MAG: sulfotransferase family protein, partial [Azospira oryzae]
MKRVESQQKLVIVLGMHRSGTSAITRGLKVIGVELGDRLEPPAAGINDKGYWEDMDLVALNVEMLDVCGRSWHSL